MELKSPIERKIISIGIVTSKLHFPAPAKTSEVRSVKGLPDDRASDRIAERTEKAGIDDIDCLMNKHSGDNEDQWTVDERKRI